MAFLLEEEHELMRKTVREFAEKELAPRAREIDQTGEFAWDLIKKCAEQNLMGMMVPEEYGGAGSTLLNRCIAIEEISRANATIGFTVGLTGPTDLIEAVGTEEQKQKYLVPLAKGEMLGGFCLTEPNAGSDASNIQTYAVRDGDYWVINGSKCFISCAGVADVYLVFAKTPNEDVKGPSAFIVEKGAPGFTFGKLEEKMGFRGSPTGELFFKDCKVPLENILGGMEKGLGNGLRFALKSLDIGRVCVAAVALGIAQASLEAAIEYAKQRKAFGKPIIEHQQISFYIAEMATEIEAARLMTYHAAALYDAGLKNGTEAAMAKHLAAQAAFNCANKSLQIHGGYGYTKAFPVERHLRDARLLSIAEGTTEILKIVISRKFTR